MGGIEIPTFGGWQITAHYKETDLTFTVWVLRLPNEEAESDSTIAAERGQLPAATQPHFCRWGD